MTEEEKVTHKDEVLKDDISADLVELLGAGAGEGGEDVPHQGDHLLPFCPGRQRCRPQEEPEVNIICPDKKLVRKGVEEGEKKPCRPYPPSEADGRATITALGNLAILRIRQTQSGRKE